MHDINAEVLTIQKSVSLAKSTYWSMVERTLKIRQISTAIKLQQTSNIDNRPS